MDSGVFILEDETDNINIILNYIFVKKYSEFMHTFFERIRIDNNFFNIKTS